MPNRCKQQVLPILFGAFLQKGGRIMISFVIDWKLVAACGATLVSLIFATKMDGSGCENVSIHAIDAVKEWFNKSLC